MGATQQPRIGYFLIGFGLATITSSWYILIDFKPLNKVIIGSIIFLLGAYILRKEENETNKVTKK